MCQLRWLDGEDNSGNVKKRSGTQFALNEPALMQMQTPRTNPNHGVAGLNTHGTAALGILINERATERLQDIFDSQALMVPLIRGGILEVEHHAGRAGIQHLDDQFRVIGWPGHLIALIRAPYRYFNTPILARGC